MPFPLSEVTGGLGATPGPLLTSGLAAQILSFEKNLCAYLKATLGVTVYPGHIPQKASLPAASYVLLDAEREARMGGATGIVDSHYRLVFASTDYSEAGDLSDKIKNGLHSMVQQDLGTSRIFKALLEDQSVSYTPGIDASDRGAYEVECDYAISYREMVGNVVVAAPVTVTTQPSGFAGITPIVMPSGTSLAFYFSSTAVTPANIAAPVGSSLVSAIDTTKAAPTVSINGGSPIALDWANCFHYAATPGGSPPPMPTVHFWLPSGTTIASTDAVTVTAPAGWATSQGGAAQAMTAYPAVNVAGGKVYADLPTTATMKIGLNLETPTYYGATLPYANLFHHSYALAGDGSLTSQPTASISNANVTIARTIFGGALAPANIVPGPYVLAWDGTSDFHISAFPGNAVEDTSRAITGHATGNRRYYTLSGDGSTCYGPNIYFTVYATSQTADSSGNYPYDFRNPVLCQEALTATPPKFLPNVVDRMRLDTIRFLDPLGTEGSNAVTFADFNKPSTVLSKINPVRAKDIPIASIGPYTGTQYKFETARGIPLLLTFAAPHGLTLGEYVPIFGYNGNPNLPYTDANGNPGTLNLDGHTLHVYPIDAYSIAMHDYNANGVATGTVTPTNPQAYIHEINGNAMPLADMVELCNDAGCDFYYNTTPSAPLDTLAQCATFIAQNLTPGKKLLVEIFNEVWNGTPVTEWCQNLTYNLYGTGGGYAYSGFLTTAQDQWNAMKDAWTAAGRSAGDFVRVLGGLSGNSAYTDIIASENHTRGYTFDMLVIAPYLENEPYRNNGRGVAQTGSASAIDAGTPAQHLDILEAAYTWGGWERCFADHFDVLTGKQVDSSGNVTYKYPENLPVQLASYEGGPSYLMLRGGSPSLDTQAKYNHAIGRHPRWWGLYQHILKIFQDSGCVRFTDFLMSDDDRQDGTLWSAYLGSGQLPYQPGSPTQDAIQINTPERIDIGESVTGGALIAWKAREG